MSLLVSSHSGCRPTEVGERGLGCKLRQAPCFSTCGTVGVLQIGFLHLQLQLLLCVQFDSTVFEKGQSPHEFYLVVSPVPRNCVVDGVDTFVCVSSGRPFTPRAAFKCIVSISLGFPAVLCLGLEKWFAAPAAGKVRSRSVFTDREISIGREAQSCMFGVRSVHSALCLGLGQTLQEGQVERRLPFLVTMIPGFFSGVAWTQTSSKTWSWVEADRRNSEVRVASAEGGVGAETSQSKLIHSLDWLGVWASCNCQAANSGTRRWVAPCSLHGARRWRSLRESTLCLRKGEHLSHESVNPQAYRKCDLAFRLMKIPNTELGRDDILVMDGFGTWLD